MDNQNILILVLLILKELFEINHLGLAVGLHPAYVIYMIITIRHNYKTVTSGMRMFELTPERLNHLNEMVHNYGPSWLSRYLPSMSKPTTHYDVVYAEMLGIINTPNIQIFRYKTLLQWYHWLYVNPLKGPQIDIKSEDLIEYLMYLALPDAYFILMWLYENWLYIAKVLLGL